MAAPPFDGAVIVGRDAPESAGQEPARLQGEIGRADEIAVEIDVEIGLDARVAGAAQQEELRRATTSSVTLISTDNTFDTADDPRVARSRAKVLEAATEGDLTSIGRFAIDRFLDSYGVER